MLVTVREINITQYNGIKKLALSKRYEILHDTSEKIMYTRHRVNFIINVMLTSYANFNCLICCVKFNDPAAAIIKALMPHLSHRADISLFATVEHVDAGN